MALTTFQGPVRSMGGFYSQGPYSVVELTADTTINPTDHAGKILLINNSTLTITLPTINSDTPVKSAGPYHKGGEPNTLSNVGISYKFIFLTSSNSFNLPEASNAVSNFGIGLK